MSTRGKIVRPWRRRNVVGATIVVAVAVGSLLALGAASSRLDLDSVWKSQRLG